MQHANGTCTEAPETGTMNPVLDKSYFRCANCRSALFSHEHVLTHVRKYQVSILFIDKVNLVAVCRWQQEQQIQNIICWINENKTRFFQNLIFQCIFWYLIRNVFWWWQGCPADSVWCDHKYLLHETAQETLGWLNQATIGVHEGKVSNKRLFFVVPNYLYF